MDKQKIQNFDDLSTEFMRDIYSTMERNDSNANDSRYNVYSDSLKPIMKKVDEFIESHAKVLEKSGLITDSLVDYIRSNVPVLRHEVLNHIQRYGNNISEQVVSDLRTNIRRTLDTTLDDRIEDAEKSESINSGIGRRNESINDTKSKVFNRNNRFVEDDLLVVLEDFSSDNILHASRILDSRGYTYRVIDERVENARYENRALLRDLKEPLFNDFDTLTNKSFETLEGKTKEFDNRTNEILGLDALSLEASNLEHKKPEEDKQNSKLDPDPKPLPPAYVDIFEATAEEMEKYMEAQKKYNQDLKEWKARHPELETREDKAAKARKELEDLIF